MATVNVLRNAIVRLDGTDVSNLVREVTVEMTADEVDTTAMGSGGKGRMQGIQDHKFTLSAYTTFGANSLHSVVYDKFKTGGTVAVLCFANYNNAGATAGTLNPSFSGSCPLLSYTPFGGAVGDAGITPLELPVDGTITVATS